MIKFLHELKRCVIRYVIAHLVFYFVAYWVYNDIVQYVSGIRQEMILPMLLPMTLSLLVATLSYFSDNISTFRAFFASVSGTAVFAVFLVIVDDLGLLKQYMFISWTMALTLFYLWNTLFISSHPLVRAGAAVYDLCAFCIKKVSKVYLRLEEKLEEA